MNEMGTLNIRPGRFGRVFTLAAVSLAVVYLTLAILVTACMASHSGHHAASHGGTAQPFHSLLCVWACQAGSPDCLSVVSPMSTTVPLRLMGIVLLIAVLLQPSFRQAQSRAPPQQALL
jgi:hypothetical protein